VNSSDWDVAVIGAGVLGTFHAYFACRRGLRTLLIERHELPRDASVRNFGMVAASAMPPGDWQRRGLESARIYQQLAEQVPFPHSRGGTQYLATTPAEVAVLQEFARLGPERGYRCQLLGPSESVALNPAVAPEHCLASLHFPDDLRLQPRALFAALIPWLQAEHGCACLPGTVAVQVVATSDGCRITTADGQQWRARHTFVCTGADLRTLFPEMYRTSGLFHCKLQMLRTEALPDLRLPTCLASGLTLRRYTSFRICPSWKRLEDEPIDPQLGQRGIHILLAQDADGRLVVGDSHQYSTPDVDDTLDSRTEDLILAEARRLVRLPHWRVAERWHGVYTLHPTRELFEVTLHGRIHILTGIGGKGMTTGPALARESIERITEIPRESPTSNPRKAP
jgi:FAD dependent oxidoreductase TIGR03364